MTGAVLPAAQLLSAAVLLLKLGPADERRLGRADDLERLEDQSGPRAGYAVLVLLIVVVLPHAPKSDGRPRSAMRRAGATTAALRVLRGFALALAASLPGGEGAR